jgi:AP-2 complex subunit alpha
MSAAISQMKGSLYSWRNSGNDGDRNPATNEYKGLVSFIADIRGARARELEEKRINKELANIRQKFREGKLNSYDKKKYVCKLLYIYILGWDLDFGHLEAVNLISASKFSEKQIGYLAVTLFFHEEHELLHLVVNSIRKDLLDHNELNNCLALHAIANIGGKSMAESLAAEVYRLLISPASKSFVKKKAALTLLRLYRKLPNCVQPQWADRIVAMMDDPDMGVALSVTSLVMSLAQDMPDPYRGCYAKAANRLKRIVVDHDCAIDYEYYNVPCPWMQVKLLRLLQYYPPSQDNHVRGLIRTAITKILDIAVEPQKNVQQNNAQNAVLFEAIKLVIHLDTEETLMVQMSSKLGKFILARETNVRDLGLEAMTHLASRSEALDPIKKHQKAITAGLKDRDITVRRQSLDLLYSMCDQSNAQSIVSELLKHLSIADYALREEMVLKIAILAERYATDAQWYVDMSLRLLSMAGDQVSEEVWQRVIQIVTNNEELQVYAVRHILRYVKIDQCHESLVKIGGYLLGEFGHLIADDSGSSPIEQFFALQNKMGGCSTETRSIILNAFIKFVNLFPEIKQQVIEVFRAFSDVLDSELQQRACEYLMLANMPSDDVLRTVFDEMPPFPERASALLSRVHTKAGKTTGDKRPMALRQDTTGFAKLAGVTSSNTPIPIKPMVSSDSNGTNDTNGANAGGMHDLLGLDQPIQSSPTSVQSLTQLSPGWEQSYNHLILRSEGVLYEDAQIQVGIRSEYRAQMGAVLIYYQNKGSSPITSFSSVTSNHATATLAVDARNTPDSTLQPQSQTQQTLMCEAKTVFANPPRLRISYLAGSMQTINLQLPVLLHKYMEPAQLTGEDFFKRWKQIGGAPREAQQVFGLGGEGRRFTVESTRGIVEGFQWGVLDGVDPNARNVVGATVLHTSEGGKFGCLMRLEPNYDTMVCQQGRN